LFEAYFSQINSIWDVVCERVRGLKFEHTFTGKNWSVRIELDLCFLQFIP